MDGHSDVNGEFDDYREALFDLLRQPSVSATGEGMDEAAAHVVSLFDDCGFESVTRIETSTYPLVYAERLATNPETAPTVVFYGHYDVQPAGDPDEWESPPFEPTVRDGSIYARGAGDNKGQFAAHAFAVDLLDRSGEFPEANVKLLVEGEEESGSAGLREYLGGAVGAGADGAPAPEIADADLVFVADGPRHAVATDDGREGRPTLVYGNRGVLSFEVAHRTANTDLHSGNFGGPVPPATNELVEALSSMFDGDRITVDGFYDGVETTDAARELAERVPDDSEALAAELGLTHLATDRPYYERLLLEPTMTVNGLSGGYQGEGTKTVLPCRAGAKLDCRLVPEQDPDAVFERVREHLTRVAPDAEVTKQSTFPPTSTPVDAPVAAPALRALESVWGEEPVELPLLGGSLPAAFFREVPALSDVPVLVVPYANHDQGNHSPNEHLDVDCFENGVLTTAAFLREFADADIGA